MVASTVDRYAVIGNPVKHSLSPFVYARFAEQTGERILYTRLLAPRDGLIKTVRDFIAQGGRGLNVTLPFKPEAYALADRVSERAAAGVVNTLCVKDKGLYGDNTDGVGLVRDLERSYHSALAGSRILLLGAGGAAHGVLLPLMMTAPAEIVVVNRTAARAAQLAQHFADQASQYRCRLIGGGRDAARGEFDIVINATSSSLCHAVPEFDARALTPHTLAYDMMYGARPTLFMDYAQSRGARAVDGLGMLVEQATESFFLWRGVWADSQPVLAQLRRALRTCP